MSGSAERRRLKILHIDPEKNWGGGEAQVIGLLSYLVAKGHRNDLLAHPDGQLIARARGVGVNVIPFVQRNDIDLRALPKIRRRIRRERYDLVHFHTKRAHALSLWLPRGEGAPKYVVTRRMDYPETRSWYTRHLYNRRVDGVVAISRTIENLLIDAGVDADKIRLIHSGIDAERFSGAMKDYAPGRIPVIGCLAVLEERKGLRYLIGAAAILKKRGVALKIHIGGDGGLRSELEESVKRHGMESEVRFLGFVTDAVAFLAASDIFVVPSLYEGLGVAALEAMAAAKPVIASRVGGLTESVVDGQTGLLVPAADSDALAAAIEKLVKDSALAVAMGQEGRKRAIDYFTLEQMARKNEEYYYEILGAVA